MATQRDQRNFRSKAGSFHTEALEGRRMLDATITATVFYDLNGNGVFEEGYPQLESRSSGTAIYIDANDNGQFDIGEHEFWTLAGGVATITGLTANTTYKIGVRPNTGQGITTQAVKAITTGADGTTTSAGNYGVKYGSLGGRVWADINGNSSYDAGEGIGSVRVYLDLEKNGIYDGSDMLAWSALTYMPDGVTPNPDAGNYLFADLPADDYEVRVVRPIAQQILTDNPLDVHVGIMQDSINNDFILTTPPATPVAPNDFNGDGKRDIIVTDGGVSTFWYMNRRICTGTAPLPSLGSGVTLVTYADFNRDGKSDLLTYHASTGTALVITMNGISTTGEVALPSANTQWKPVGAGDFNGDGDTDIVWRNQTTGQNTTWLMSGTDISSFKALPSTADNNWYIAGVADYDNDGKDDLVWRHRVSGRNTTWLLNGTSTPAFSALPSTADQNWRPVAISAFNSDNIPDILWLNSVTHANSIWYMTAGQPTFGQVIFKPE